MGRWGLQRNVRNWSSWIWAGAGCQGRMQTLLLGFHEYMFQKDEYCIFILGLNNAGKITFLEQSKTWFNKNYKVMNLSKITTTVWLNIGSVDMGKSRLMFWNLSGQEELQSLWNKYCAECRGIVYVIDFTDEERLPESKEAFEKVVSSEALDGNLVLVLANKQNVETCLTIRDIKTTFSDHTCKIGQRVCLTQVCSALTGKGVPEGIECIMRKVHRPPQQKDITKALSTSQSWDYSSQVLEEYSLLAVCHQCWCWAGYVCSFIYLLYVFSK